jgi:branched-chain amino acid transport system substrate-binding protein
MNITQKLPGLKRRDFLKTLGLISGGMMASEVSALRADVNGASAKIGVLVPQSNLYPLLGDSFTTGFKLALAPTDRVDVIVEDSGFTAGCAVEKCRRLIETIKVDAIVAFLNSEMGDELRPLVEKARIPLVLCPVGARLHKPQTQSPYVVCNSLNYWQSCWAMGKWAAQHVGTKALIAASFYESGYDAHYAFHLGFEAGGGEILATRITDAPYNPGGVYAFMTEAEQTKPDLIFGCYSGHQGLPFLHAYKSSGLSNQIPLIGSAFLVDELALATHGQAAVGIRSCFPWALTLATPANEIFVQSFQEKTRRIPDVFALHGYETGLWLSKALGAGSVRWLHEALREVEFEGPRGAFVMDRRTGCSRTPLYLREVVRQGGVPANRVMDELPSVDESDDRLVAFESGVRTGWTNTYFSV